MSNSNEADEEQPLDPAMERVRRKMVRLLVISIGIMVVGLMAVLGAIVYKIGNYGKPEATVSGQTATPAALRSELALPAGAKVLSASLAGENMLIAVQLADGSREYFIVDLKSGAVVNRLHVK